VSIRGNREEVSPNQCFPGKHNMRCFENTAHGHISHVQKSPPGKDFFSKKNSPADKDFLTWKDILKFSGNFCNVLFLAEK